MSELLCPNCRAFGQRLTMNSMMCPGCGKSWSVPSKAATSKVDVKVFDSVKGLRGLSLKYTHFYHGPIVDIYLDGRYHETYADTDSLSTALARFFPGADISEPLDWVASTYERFKIL